MGEHNTYHNILLREYFKAKYKSDYLFNKCFRTASTQLQILPVFCRLDQMDYRTYIVDIKGNFIKKSHHFLAIEKRQFKFIKKV